MRMPLGSGLFEAMQPDPNLTPLAQAGLFQSPTNLLGLRIPKMKLGSGMYDMADPAAGNFPLGSGLFGQPALPQAAPQQQQMPQQQAAPQAAGGDGMDKFNQLLNSPMFQFGMNLLGASNSPNPWGPALQGTLSAQLQSAQAKRQQALADMEGKRVGIEQQRANTEQQRASAQTDLEQQLRALQQQQFEFGKQKYGETEAPLAQSEIGLRTAQSSRLGTESLLDAQKLAMAQQQMSRQNAIMDQAQQMFGGSNGGLFGSGAAPTSVPAPQSGASGTYGTPAWLLDGLRRTESGGNPTARGPVLPDGTRAQGSYQFTPATTSMLAKQGMQFNPDDPTQSRDAADFYLQKLLQQSGGDYKKALAAYGGFKSKDPTPYINKVTGGMPLPGVGGAVTGPQPVQSPGMTGDQGVGMMKMGALAGLAGVPGAQGLVELGKNLQPQTVAGGTYQRDPQSGNMTFTPDPYKERSLNIETAKAGQELKGTQAKEADKQAADRLTVQNAQAGFGKLTDTVRDLVQTDANGNVIGTHPGMDYHTGVLGALPGVSSMTQSGRDYSAKIATLKGQQIKQAIDSLRESGSNGSTGMGRFTEQEIMQLQNAQANLNNAQSKEQTIQALRDLQQNAQSGVARATQHYNSLYGAPDSPNVAPSQGATPLSMPDYSLQKGQPRAYASSGTSAPQGGASSTHISSREMAGKIAPAPGTVEQGHRFKGGNPADPANWERVQ